LANQPAVRARARPTPAPRSHSGATQNLHYAAGVDTHRAAQCTETIGRTRVDTRILKKRAQSPQASGIFARGLQACKLAQTDDALPRSQAQIARRAGQLAESALDTLVYRRIDREQQLEILDMYLAVIV
jgi:hypothetical protein